MSYKPPQCMICIHFDKENFSCPNYGQEIPEDILRNIHNHKRPYGNEKLLFEKVKWRSEKDFPVLST